MHSKLISRLLTTSWVILVASFCLGIYLALSAPATFIVTDRQAKLVEIEATTSIAELKAQASGLAMVGNNATQISRVLFGVAVWTFLVFTVLSVLNLVWLRRLRRATDEHTTA
jgi:hypothetical protein